MVDRPEGSELTGRTRVVLGPFSSAAFVQGLRSLLTETGEFEVTSIDDPPTLPDTDDADRPSVLIAEGVDAADCATFLDDSVSRSVVLFDPVGARAFVGLNNPDWPQLVDVIRAVVPTGQRDDPQRVEDRVRLVDPLRLVSQGPVAWAPSSTNDVEPLVEWLTLGFGRALLRRAGSAETSIPGWSVSAEEALRQLGFGPTPSSEAEVLARWEAADRAMVVTGQTMPSGLARLARLLDLGDHDLRLLCWALAPEIDGRYATAIGVLHDDLTRRRPSPTLLAELSPDETQSAWEIRRNLARSGSIESMGLLRAVGADRPPTEFGYEPTPVVVAQLLAPSIDDFMTTVGATLIAASSTAAEPAEHGDRDRREQLRRELARESTVVHLIGDHDGRDWATRVLAEVGTAAIVGDLRSVAGHGAGVDSITDWVLASRLTGAGLVVLGLDSLADGDRRRALTGLAAADRLQLLLATDGTASIRESRLQPRLVLTAPVTTTTARAAWWGAAADATGERLSPSDVELLSTTVRIEPPAVETAMALAANRKRAGAGGSIASLAQEAAGDLFPILVPPGGRRIVATYRWDDIVLPEATMELLRSIATHLVKSGTVMERWGFDKRVPYGRGVAALFSGPSGTGKTMAAQIIAGEIGVDVLQVDLSKTVSKYIGETEKNLDRLFDAAERSGAVLLFDEADAIFGKRTEVKDAHDRHANVEVAYLLQRMEAFAGLAILTTNLKQNIDGAFFRRLRFVIDFAMPTAADRLTIWHRVFPPSAPLAADLDLSFLARRLPISGGSIQNIALHAAYLAAADGEWIGSSHVLAASRRELLKIGMLTAERSLDELAA